jgi:hypothetical protein
VGARRLDLWSIDRVSKGLANLIGCPPLAGSGRRAPTGNKIALAYGYDN